MARDKRKRVMAWILLGALLAGSLNPVTANAAELSERSQISSEAGPGAADEKESETQTDEGETPAADENKEDREEDTTGKDPADTGNGEEDSEHNTDAVTDQDDTEED
ncbi:MAG: hypothetical protein K2O13_08800, partial [Lachnospiraceae bacterium]|nr:hypothetical protein [Lachnospiraceae bacterium]